MRTGHFREKPGQLIALSDSRTVWGWTLALLVALALAPLVISAYGLTLMVAALIAVVGAIALNILRARLSGRRDFSRSAPTPTASCWPTTMCPSGSRFPPAARRLRW